MVVGPGNEHDSQKFEHVVSSIRLNIGRGRPKSRPKEILADAAYDTETIRAYLRRRGIKSSIPENKRNQKRPTIGRPTRLIESHTRNEGQLSDSLDGSNWDLGELQHAMKTR